MEVMPSQYSNAPVSIYVTELGSSMDVRFLQPSNANPSIPLTSDIKDYALQAAISGKHWSGYKLVEGRATRRYTDENAVIAAVKAAGYDPYDEPKVLGVTAMTTLLGKKQFNDILGGLIVKPQGKPTLVPENDKRPAMTTIIDDFKEEN